MSTAIIADDEKIALSSLQKLIDWQSLNLTLAGKATNGIMLLEQILETKPDIVITDICMPGMDGLHVIAKTLEAGLSIRFIIISAYTNFEYARTAIKLGVEDFLPKPLKKSELNETIRDVICKLDKDAIQQNAYSNIVRAAKAYMDENYSQHLTLEKVAAVSYVSPNYLSMLFKRETGVNFLEYLTDIRLNHAYRMLDDPSYSIKEIASVTGYKNTEHFTNLFQKKYGLSPAKYRKNKANKQEAGE